MEYEDKVKLLEIFNVMNWDRPWSEEYQRKFINEYKALACAMAGPILTAIDNSELRKSVKVVKLAAGEYPKVKPNTPYLLNFGEWDKCGFAGEDGLVRTITTQAAAEVRLSKVTPETVEKMMRKVAQAIVNYEIQVVNMLKDIVDTDDITLYVRQDYVPYDDPTLIKRQHIGIFGWEEFSVVAE
jgi:hypothetical protein